MQPKANSPIWLLLISSAIASATGVFVIGPGHSYLAIWGPRLLALLLALMVSFVIYSSGQLLLRFFYQEPGLDAIIISWALGTLIVPGAILILGYAGWLHLPGVLIVITAINIAGWRQWCQLYTQITDLIAQWRQAAPPVTIILALAFSLLLLNLLHACMPPLDYDVLEYHLGAPAEYYKHGHIFFISDNVYANFPQNMEMLALLYMQLAGKLIGAIAAKFGLAIYAIALAIAVYRLAALWFDCQAAVIAALLVYCLPWTSVLLRTYYVEIPTVFLLVFSLYLISNPGFPGKRRYLLAGLILGASAGIKYTTLFLGSAAIIPILLSTNVPWRGKLRNLASISAGFLLAFSPWLIRNYLHTGNPIYPLFNPWLAPGYWSELMYARFRQAHAPANLNLIETMRCLWQTFVTDSHNSLLFIMLLPGAGLLLRRRLWSLAGFISIWLGLWLLFTHRISRFVYVVTVLACVPMGATLIFYWRRFPPRVANTVLAIIAALTFYQHSYLTIPGAYDYLLGMQSMEQLLTQHYPPYHAEEFLNQQSQGRVLMIGEARIFYLDRPLVANTVFDRNLLELLFQRYHSTAAIAAFLKKQDIRYLYFNWNEVSRLRQTYAFHWKGRKYTGFLQIDLSRLNQFLDRHCRKVFPGNSGKQPDRIEVYYVK